MVAASKECKCKETGRAERGGTALPANKRTAPARARRPAAVTGGLARARRAGGEGWGATKARTGSAAHAANNNKSARR